MKLSGTTARWRQGGATIAAVKVQREDRQRVELARARSERRNADGPPFTKIN